MYVTISSKSACLTGPADSHLCTCFASLSWRRHWEQLWATAPYGPKTRLRTSIVPKRTLSLHHVSVAKTGHFWGTKENLLYIQTKTSVLARNFSAPKRTNVPASAFHKPLDLCWMSAILPSHPSPSSMLKAWPVRSNQISGCQGACDVSCH